MCSKCNVYLDASGDSGFKFGAGSTRTFTIAALVEHESHTEQNKALVSDAKRIIGCNPRNELKYVTLKKHRKKWEVLSVLSGIQADLMIVSVVKERLEKKSTTFVNAGWQSLAVEFALRHVAERARVSRAEVWADATNTDIERLIQKYVDHGCNSHRGEFAEMISDVRFPSSDSVRMIQAADIFAGAGAEFIEANIDAKLCGHCPLPIQLQRRRGKCARVKLRKKIRKLDLYDLMLPMLARTDSGSIFGAGLYVSPEPERWFILDCAK